MATQQAGLFTQGPSVEDLLQQRNTQATNLQQQLMAQAAQGSRTPAKARAFSLLGSSLGRALSGAVGGGQDQQLAEIRAKQAAQKGLQEQALTIGVNGTSAQQAQLSQDLHKAGYMQAAVDMANKSKATRDQEDATLQAAKEKREDALELSIKTEDIATALAATTAQNNALADTVASYMTAEDVANIRAGDAGAIAYAYKVKGEKRKQKEAELSGTSDANKLRFTEVGTFSDGKGNMYSVTKSLDPKAEHKLIYTAIGGAPTYDPNKQKLTPTNTAGLTQEQQVEMTRAKEEAKAQSQSWEDAKVAARAAHGDLLESQSFVTRALDILPKIRTGGLVVEGAKAFTDAFGITTDDVGEFHVLTATTALGMLRTTFGASPTEGERAILMSIQASIGNSKGLNKRILGRAKAMVEFRLKMNKKALTSKDAREYDAFLLEQEAPTWTDEKPKATTATPPDIKPTISFSEWQSDKESK